MESAFLNFIISWGPTAVSSLLVFVVSFLIKYIIANAKKDEHRVANIRKEIKEIHDDVNKTLNRFEERLSNVERKASKIERESLKCDIFYKELSGWRSEINRLSDQMSQNFSMLINNIMQWLSQGK